MSDMFLIITAAIGIVCTCLVWFGWNTSCPDCNKWFSRSLINTEEFSRRNDFETVTRRDKPSQLNESSSTWVRKEQVCITYLKHRNFYSCRKCDHDWTIISSSKFEG